jgi:predicted glycoside hydrolase/deacetylase ChbG (UPF0249 family)
MGDQQEIVIHADDVGMCHGANAAFVELSQLGSISAGSVMVPCPWFSEMAQLATQQTLEHPLDLGVHLTLNSEQKGYRWGPVSQPSQAAGLTDQHGYFWPTVAEVQRHAAPEAVEAEWRAQIDRALAVGIDVTHLDAHMGSAMAPEYCERYVAVGVDYDVPVLLTSTFAAYDPGPHILGATEEAFATFVDAARAAGMPLFGRCLETNFGRPRGEPVDYEALLHSDPSDLIYCAFHPCRPGPGEVEVIEPGSHHVRVDEYELFRTLEWCEWLGAQHFSVIGMREIRDRFRAARPHR